MGIGNAFYGVANLLINRGKLDHYGAAESEFLISPDTLYERINGVISFVAENPVRAVASHTQVWLSRWYKEVSTPLGNNILQVANPDSTRSYLSLMPMQFGAQMTGEGNRRSGTGPWCSRRRGVSARCCYSTKRMCSSGLRNEFSRRTAARSGRRKESWARLEGRRRGSKAQIERTSCCLSIDPN